MEYGSVPELLNATRAVARASVDGAQVEDPQRFRAEILDDLVWTAIFGADEAVRDVARWMIWACGQALGTYAASIEGSYQAKGHGAYANPPVPAVNLHSMTYTMARALFRMARAGAVGALICEIVRSEIGYTRQRPAEFVAVVLGAALREGVTGPVFIQGDHFQVKATDYLNDRALEMEAARRLVREAVAAGFYNIDVDSSTLVDLTRPTRDEQQRDDYRVAAELTHFIRSRSREPHGVTMSVGGEIGEVGGQNSTVPEFEAFMQGYLTELDKLRPGAVGLSKISVQTGTSHGGVPLSDGTVAEAKLDLQVLADISDVAQRKFGLAGTVQHGASTLPEAAFDSFPRYRTSKIHLATAFQNMIYDGGHLPAALRDRVYAWPACECAAERKPDDSDQQFYYKTRKKGFGPFKREWWSLPLETCERISADLETRFALIFKKLNVENTRGDIEDSVSDVMVSRPMPSVLANHL